MRTHLRSTHFAQITPAFVREAYSLLRQSIIHVEQDDIDFDEEELEGERDGDRRPRVDQEEESQDVEMSAAEVAAMDETEQSYNEASGSGPGGLHGATSSDQPTSRAASAAPAPAPRPKRRMVITHDKYMTLQSLIVLHLSQVERETGKGVDRDELIDWYLETKESEVQDVEELEYEKELITKMLKKLVKVRCPFTYGVVPSLIHPIRTTTSLRSRVMCKRRCLSPWKRAALSLHSMARVAMSAFITWYIHPWTPMALPLCHRVGGRLRCVCLPRSRVDATCCVSSLYWCLHATHILEFFYYVLPNARPRLGYKSGVLGSECGLPPAYVLEVRIVIISGCRINAVGTRAAASVGARKHRRGQVGANLSHNATATMSVPSPFTIAHRKYVQGLYRRMLSNELNWTISREAWRGRALAIRAEFERNRCVAGVTVPRTKADWHGKPRYYRYAKECA